MRRLAVLLLALACLLAAPAVAGAQQNPFGPLPAPSQPEPEPTVTRDPLDTSDDGLEGWQEVLILLAGVALIGGIAWAIIGDARRAAPVDERDAPRPAGVTGDGRDSGGRDPEQRRRAKAKARKKQKVARASRKKNR